MDLPSSVCSEVPPTVVAAPLRRRPPLWVGAGLGVVGMAPGEVTEAMNGTEDPEFAGAGRTPGDR